MVYEIYIDSLLIELLVWNLCVLGLTGAVFYGSAGGGRIFLGSLFGAGTAVGSLLAPIGFGGRVAGFLGGGVLMLGVTFPVRSLRGFGKVLETYLKFAILLGGSMLWLLRLPMLGRWNGRVAFSLSVTVILTGCGKYFLRKKKSVDGAVGTARLIRGEKKISVKALVDSGNSLTEPISGQPVCVLDEDPAGGLWGEEDLYRVVPYRCVGTPGGLMKAYLVSRMELELEGPVRVFRNVYVAVSPQKLAKEEGEAAMLIHPALLTIKQTKSRRKKKEGGRPDDHEYCITQENPVQVAAQGAGRRAKAGRGALLYRGIGCASAAPRTDDGDAHDRRARDGAQGGGQDDADRA